MSNFLNKTLNKIVGQSSKYKDSQHNNNVASASSNTAAALSQHQHYLQQQQQLQDTQLTLAHLRKVFYEYLHPKSEPSQNDKDEKLYNILPLFIKAFGQSSLIDVYDKFGDINEFTFVCTKLLVKEIKKRSGGHDDTLIVKFFEIKSSDETSDGCGLLNVVNLLASGPVNLVEIMSQCSLPSCLVMCLFLFICLPEAKDSMLDYSEFSATERRILFQKSFQQLLIKICQHGCTCDELSDSDALKYLFNTISSICELHNLSWRRTAADALVTLSKNFTIKAINYIHQNDYIQKTLESIDDNSALNLIEKTDVILTLLAVLKDSSKLSQILLDDFRSIGYRILSDIILRLEKETREDMRLTLKNLLFFVEDFVYVGYTELKISSNAKAEMFQVPGFRVPSPLGKGRTIQNIYAFQCLLNIFNKCQTTELSLIILNKVKNIYEKDDCNYYLLESNNVLLYSLDDFSIKIHNKPHDIQLKFIEILEHIVTNLKFVPSKELVSMGLAIQNNNHTQWSIICANFLFKLVKLNQIYKDAYRELGILEMMISCLHKFAALLKEKYVNLKDEIEIEPVQRELGFQVMDIVASLLTQNSQNAKIFRELGGARLAHNMVPYKLCRNQALNIVSTLLLNTGGEDDMATLLGLMHTAKLEDLELKNAVLKSLLYTLRESHRTRTAFRKVGGFVYVISVLISMEGCLAVPSKSPWNKVSKYDVYTILKTIFHTLTVAMRYEPANAKFFETEVRWKSLTDALKLIGCFNELTQFDSSLNDNTFVKRNFDVFEKFFCSLDEKCLQPYDIDEKIVHACYIMRYLYDTAIDAFDKSYLLVDFNDGFDDRPFLKYTEAIIKHESSPKQYIDSSDELGPTSAYMTPTNLHHQNTFMFTDTSSIKSPFNLNNPLDEPLIVHPGAISAILHLSVCVFTEKSNQMDKRLQYHMVNLLKNLCRFDRNQQIMSSAAFVDDLLYTCKNVLNEENHFLNASIQHIFERLASQVLTAKNLREYLRLGSIFSLNINGGCTSPFGTNNDNINKETYQLVNQFLNTSLVPLNRIKCLISMTTPRDYKTYIGTPFIEFNMFVEGFGCIFLPSIAPQLSSPPSIVAMGMVSVGTDLNVNGGVGVGERFFPPQSGLTYSTWICVDKFGSLSFDKMHPIRILTLLRHTQTKDILTSCLTVFLSPRSRSLIISTEETPLQRYDPKISDNDLKPSEYLVKFNCSELFQEGQWLHIVLVFNRAMIKNSSISVYVNSNLIGNSKLHYINSFSATNQQHSTSIHAVIGTLPALRMPSAVIWRQGNCYMFEDALSYQAIQCIYKLGPGYLGSFQSPPIDYIEANSMLNSTALVSEDKIVFGIHAQNIFEMTLAKFRKIYNKNDSKTIGKLLNIPSSESATPIRILSNTAGQLNGPARSVGGAIIGFLGVRTFQPQPVSKSVENIGSVAFLLGLTAMANDIEFMYAAVKALVCIIKSNKETAREMDRLNGYQLLAMLYRRKKGLINSHTLNLTFSLVISDDLGKEQAIITNSKAFEALLVELEVWYETPNEIQRSLHERFNDLLNDQATNGRLFYRLGMLKHLLYVIKGHNLNDNTLKYILSTIKILLTEINQSDNILKYGQFLISLLPENTFNEKTIDVKLNYVELKEKTIQADTDLNNTIYMIRVRNKLLQIIDEIISLDTNEKSLDFVEDFQKTLGYDWFLLFMQHNIHSTTVIKITKILFTIIINNLQNLTRYKECQFYGGWLSDISIRLLACKTNVLNNTAELTNSSANPQFEREINIEACAAPGFQIIQNLFSKHVEITELYYLLFALLFDSQKIRELPQNADLDLNSICKYVFDRSFDSEQTMFTKINIEFGLDVSVILLSMIRSLMNSQQQVQDLTESISKQSSTSSNNANGSSNSSNISSSSSNSSSTSNITISNNFVTKDYAIILLQIFRYMYHNCDDFRLMASNADFLAALLATLYPYTDLSESQAATPLVEVKPFAEALCDTSIKYNSYLTTHPARKLVMDFVRDLIVDSLSTNNSGSKSSIIDYILLSLPEANVKRNQELVTEIFKCIMDCLMTSDIFNDEAINTQYVAQNIANLVDRLVDKLWDGMYKRDSKEVFDLIIKLINNMKRKCSANALDQLICSMNRTILYQLSRSIELLTDQIMVLDVLHRITNLKSIVFSQLNTQYEFFACVAHCLLTLTDTSEGHSKSEWYVPIPESTNETKNDAKQLLISAAQRVWLDMYLTKKSQLEEGLRINLNSNGKIPTLDQLRPIMSEPATKVWLNFIEGEKKLPDKIQSQLQQKFQKVTGGISTVAGGISRVVSLKKPKKDIPRLTPNAIIESVIQMEKNMIVVKEILDVEFRKYYRVIEQHYNYLHDEWIKIEKDLLRERGIWGDENQSLLNKWKLDSTEGPNRTRKRLIPNDQFYRMYPYRPEVDLLKPNRKYKIPTSFDSKEFFKRFKVKSLLHQETLTYSNNQARLESVTVNDSLEITDTETEEKDANSPPALVTDILGEKKSSILTRQAEQDDEDEFNNSTGNTATTNNTTTSNNNSASLTQSTHAQTNVPNTLNSSAVSTDQDNSDQNNSNNQSILRLLEDGEKINYTYRCARVQGLDTIEGVLLFGKEHFYVLNGYTLLSPKDIVDIDSLKLGTYEPLIPKGGSSSANQVTEKACSKFAYEDIKEVHKRRYLLQPIALEIFSNDGRNYLLVFPRKCRNKVFERLVALTPDLTDSAQQSIAGQKRSMNVEQGAGLLNVLIGEKSVTQRWERGEISNFQYLMYLNTLAGRSYNDLMQYPVFPWILADYDSDELDLYNKNTFRDLSKPMGAQTSERLKQFRKRFQEWDDPSGETPPYHYGTHYSSAMIVASYLVRMEPFTQIFLRLQGGHFDLADRMFHSVKDNWLSASKNNMADVKELIPEFFYLPEFLVNSNKFDFGRKQNGIVLNDVVLPTWAKNDAREFIRVHRMALESDYVSAHLNEWIDLIFGYKQQGPASVDAVNVFHHLFYEGAVNIDDINDTLKRNAIIGFINNFGQIPKQLFKKPHPCKKLNSQLITGVQDNKQIMFFHYLNCLKPSLQPIKELKSQVGQIMPTDKGIIVVEQNKFLMPPNYQRYIAWGYADESVKIGYTDYEKSYVSFENIQDGAIFCCCSPDSKLIITAGTSTVVNVFELGKSKLRRLQLKSRLYGHTDTVTCMAVSNAYHMLVTGSRDQTCIVWDINRCKFVRQLPNHVTTVSCVCINEVTGDIASASGTYLYVWSINGELLASVNTIGACRNQVILCICMSQINEWDSDNVILTGGTDGVVRMWSLDYRQEAIDESQKQKTDSNCENNLNLTKIDETLNTSNKKSPDNINISSQQKHNNLMLNRNNNNIPIGGIEQRKQRFNSSGGESDTEFSALDFVQNMSNSSKKEEQLQQFENDINEEGAARDYVNSNIEAEADDEYIMINKTEAYDKSKSQLKPGHKWIRYLVFRSKLTMHTAYDRKDNSQPASVSAITISKDHKTIYVGDTRGRVYSWTVSEAPGRTRADHWVRDELVESCKACHVKFSFSERKHHCRDCGHVYCNTCTRFETEIHRLNITKPVRVCQTCYNAIKAEENISVQMQTSIANLNINSSNNTNNNN